ncbi:MAG TPA: addiction module protein [Thermoanaerobaculia bacterium]|nr:addiction module protein [Thermoanaerobaculia bacterium]
MRDQAMTLTPEERGQLAEELLDSVESDKGIEWDDEYAAEIRRRVAEVRAGTAKMVSADEAIAAARRAIDDVRRTARRG